MLLGSFGWINFEQLRRDPKVFLLELQSSLDGHVVADQRSALWHSLAEETGNSNYVSDDTCAHMSALISGTI